MELKLSINKYVPNEGLKLSWEPGSKIEIRFANGELLIKANDAGLASLANHLLTLSQKNVPPGEHLHLDDSNALEQGSIAIVVERQ